VPIAKNNTKNKIIFISLVIILLAFLGYLATARKTTTVKSGKLAVSTSFYPLYYFTTQIAGNKADVINITPSGAEPHDYDPSAGDIAKIEKGNLLVLNGGVEAWGNKIADNLKGTNVQVVVAGQGLLTQQVEESGQNQIDPHVWLDPVLAKQEAHAIAEGFIKIDPANTAYYRQNENVLNTKLDSLDAEYKAGLADCQEKDIITSHAAFGYLATRYGLTQVTVTGLSPDAEPSAQQLADVVAFAKLHKVKYIFFEKLISPKLSDTVATEVGAKTLVLDPIEGVSGDDMKAGKNYYTIMQDNLKNLQTALSCLK
jgi:zinc transport system substrate-binding protein